MRLITKKDKNSEIKKRDGYLIVVLGWLFMTIFGSLPYLISGSIPSITNAFLRPCQVSQQLDQPFLTI